jgi:hypothetical protein
MQLTTSRTFTITLSEEEAEEIARFLVNHLDGMICCIPDHVIKLSNVLNTELTVEVS